MRSDIKIKLFLLFILLATSLSSFAYVEGNLLSSSRTPFKKIPVYGQGAIGNCYSFASVNVFDYLRVQKGLIKSFDDLTSTLWASVIFREKTLFGILAEKTGIGFDRNSPLESGDAVMTLAALRYYGSCSRKTVAESIYQAYPELRASKTRLSAEEFTGIVHLIDIEWKKLYAYASLLMQKDENLPRFNGKYQFPSARIKLQQRGSWKIDSKTAPLEWNEIESLELRQPIAKQDNTYVAPNYVDPFPLLKKETQRNSSSGSGQNNSQTASGGSKPLFSSKNYEDLRRSLLEKNTVKIDNTYVARSYTKTLYSEHLMASAYASQTLKNALKKKYGVNFKFVGKLLAKLKEKDGYWSVIKKVIEPCFSKAQKIASTQKVKQYLPYSGGDFINKVEKLIDAKEPIAIEYCSEVLLDGKAHGAIFSKKCGMHLSVIVGYREVGGRHQMLIQNSWGKSCSGYYKGWKCKKEQGALWVDSDVLANSSYRLIWL